jgi:hypothetical protein
MQYALSPQDYELMVQQFDGDVEAANAMLRERGYSIPGEEPSSLAVTPPREGGPLEPWQQEHLRNMESGLGDGGTGFEVNAPADPDADEGETSDLSVDPNSLAGVLAGQRKSIGALYDKITQNIQQRYRKPDINDLLINVGMGMMSAPGENDSGGFGGAVQRGLRGLGTYAQSLRAYDTDMNKALSGLEIEKAKQMAALEGKYLTSAAAALKPRTPSSSSPVTVGPDAVVRSRATGSTIKEPPQDAIYELQTYLSDPSNTPQNKVIARRAFDRNFGYGASDIYGGQ